METGSKRTTPSQLRQVSGAASAHTLAMALSLVSGPLLARALGDVGRGEMAAVVVPVQLFGWIVMFGLPYAATVMIGRVDRDRLLRAAWLASCVVAVVVSLPLIIVAGDLRPGLSPSSLLWFRAGLLIAPFTIASAVEIRLRLIERGAGWVLGVTNSLYLFLFTAAVVALAVTDRLTTRTAIASWILAYGLQAAFILVRYSAVRMPARSTTDLRRATRIGLPFAIGTISEVLLGRIDQVVMASTVGLRDLGVYAVAATAAQATLPLTKAMADTSFAALIGGHRKGGSMTTATFILSLGASLVIGLTAPALVPAVFGDDFSASVPLLRLLLPGQVAFNTALVAAQRFDAGQRPEIRAKAMALAAGVNVILIVPVTSTWGAEGAAILTSASQLLFAGVIFFESRREANA